MQFIFHGSCHSSYFFMYKAIYDVMKPTIYSTNRSQINNNTMSKSGWNCNNNNNKKDYPIILLPIYICKISVTLWLPSFFAYIFKILYKATSTFNCWTFYFRKKKRLVYMYFSLTKSFYHLSETAKGKRGIVHYNPLWM